LPTHHGPLRITRICEDTEEETDVEAVERMKNAITSQFEEQLESVSSLQVYADKLVSKVVTTLSA